MDGVPNEVDRFNRVDEDVFNKTRNETSIIKMEVNISHHPKEQMAKENNAEVENYLLLMIEAEPSKAVAKLERKQISTTHIPSRVKSTSPMALADASACARRW